MSLIRATTDQRWWLTRSLSKHPQRLHIGLQDGLLFLALVGILLAQAPDGAQCLHVEAIALALGIDVADIVGDRLLLFFQPLDALDDRLELILGEAGCLIFVLHGGGGGHLLLLKST
jgi:hypothetical protein